MNLKKILISCSVVIMAFTAMGINPARAEVYPNHPVKLLTMTGPGSQIDLVTRAFADRLKNILGQPVLVTNMPGGSHGSVMATELATSPADGYTLGVSATGAFNYSPYFIKTKYTKDDFDYLCLIALNQSGIIASPDKPWKTLKDTFEWAKAEGKGLTYMFQGSDDRDAMDRIAKQEGVKLSLMPSTGGPSIITAVMGGHADLGHVGAILFDYVDSGKLKLLAASTPVRLTPLPDVPTLKELGYNESVEMFVAFVTPKGLPEDIKAKLNDAAQQIVNNPEFIDFVEKKLKMAPVDSSREYAVKYIEESSKRNQELISQNKK